MITLWNVWIFFVERLRTICNRANMYHTGGNWWLRLCPGIRYRREHHCYCSGGIMRAAIWKLFKSSKRKWANRVTRYIIGLGFGWRSWVCRLSLFCPQHFVRLTINYCGSVSIIMLLPFWVTVSQKGIRLHLTTLILQIKLAHKLPCRMKKRLASKINQSAANLVQTFISIGFYFTFLHTWARHDGWCNETEYYRSVANALRRPCYVACYFKCLTQAALLQVILRTMLRYAGNRQP